jgi:anti-sigma factor RsiW
MDCETSTTLLPWLLNGSLDPAELEELGRHVAACDRCREELARTRLAFDLYGSHPAAAELAEYVAGELPAVAAATVADHLGLCAECRDEVELLTASRRETESAFGPFESNVVPLASTTRAWRWRALAAAATPTSWWSTSTPAGSP